MKNLISVSVLCLATLAASDYALADDKDWQLLQQSDLVGPGGNPKGTTFEGLVEEWEGEKRQTFVVHVVTVKGTDMHADQMLPASGKGRKVLMKGRSMWFAKPGLSKPVPISPRQRLLGSASNADLATANYSAGYTIVSVTDDSVEGNAARVYELTAKQDDEVYPKVKLWVSKDRKVRLKAEFYTKAGLLLKTAMFEYASVEDGTGGGARVYPQSMTIREPNAKDLVTVIRYRKFNAEPVSDAMFNVNLLVQ